MMRGSLSCGSLCSDWLTDWLIDWQLLSSKQTNKRTNGRTEELILTLRSTKIFYPEPSQMWTKEVAGLPPTTNDITGRHLRFSQRCCWQLSFSVTWRCVVGWIVFDVSKKCGAFETSRTTHPSLQRHIPEDLHRRFQMRFSSIKK